MEKDASRESIKVIELQIAKRMTALNDRVRELRQ
jgi:hypothetical protein